MVKLPLLKSLAKRIVADSIEEAKRAFSKEARKKEIDSWSQLFHIYEEKRDDNTIRRESVARRKDK